MKNSIYKKIFVILFLVAMISIAILLVAGVVNGRIMYQNEAATSITHSWANRQNLIAPILRIPYLKTYTTRVTNPAGFESEEKRQTPLTAYFNPQHLKINVITDTETRNRGIYSFPVYQAQIEITGSFHLPARAGLIAKDEIEFAESALIDIAISDRKGISNTPEFTVNNQNITATPGHCPYFQSGLISCTSATYQLKPLDEEQILQFKIKLLLKGYQQFQVAALGDYTEVNLLTKWQHPKFIGAFSPNERKLNKDSYEAKWLLTSYATDVVAELKRCDYADKCNFYNQMLGFELYQPIDIYQQVERSMKYAILFITLTFASFFVFEICTKKALHPIQYGFIGLMQTIFYLLLISISEHISFGLAYSISTIACITIIGVYLRSVLGTLTSSLAYTFSFALLYALLYFLLQSEDYALLLGTMLLFIVLAAAMLITRKVDWYSVGSNQEHT